MKILRSWILAIIVIAAVAPVIVSRAQTRQTPPKESRNFVREREEWFYGQREYPLGHIPAGARLKAFNQLQQMLRGVAAMKSGGAAAAGESTPAQTAIRAAAITLSQTNWTSIGPQPTLGYGDMFSGRVTALAFDPRDSTDKTIYLGAAEGGLWVTTDGGQNWTPLTDSQPSLAVGSIALDPTTNPTTIYVGTGEQNFSIDSYYGAGVLKSTDGGKTWTKDSTFVPSGVGSGPTIGAIAVDPSNNQILLAATNYGTGNGVIWRSTDGGNTWASVLTESFPGYGTGAAFDPNSPGVAYVALGDIYGGNADNGVYRSTDDGATWAHLSISGLTPTASGRITLAVGPPASSGKPGEVLVSVADPSNGNLLGLWLSADGGNTWTQLTSAPNFCALQCWYDMAIGIDPQNASVLYAGGNNDLGGEDLIVSTDGGATWSPDLYAGNGAGGGSGTSVLHTDTHAIAFSPDGATLAVGNDGGVWSTTNVAVGANITWNNLNGTLATTQFYPGISIFPGNPNEGLGGTQDNGTQLFTGTQQWQEQPYCGDGGYTAFDPSGSTEYMICAANQGLWANRGSGWVWAGNGIGTCTTSASSCYSAQWVAPLAMDPQNPSTLYFAAHAATGSSYVVYQSTDGASSWQTISPDLSGTAHASVSSIGVAPTNSDVVYAATSAGTLWKTTNATTGAGSNWQEADSGLPNRSLTDVVVDPLSSSTVYASFSGFSSCSSCDGKGHIYETTDGGTTWTNITGNLPDTPVNALAVDPVLANTIYAATDTGVFVTLDGGSTWTPAVSGLPNVITLGLALDPATRTLWAGTHGRSMWSLQLPPAPTAALSPTSLVFGSEDFGTISPAQAVKLTNSGGVALAITGITAGSGFDETDNCGTSLASASSCTINVTFAPNASGNITGALKISDNLRTSPQTVALSGTGIAAPQVSLSSPSVTFGNQDVGSASGTQTETLTNSGDAQLSIFSISISGPYTETNDCGTSLSVKANCSINVVFSPTAVGSASGTLTISDNGPGSGVQVVPLSGAGQDFTLSASPSSGSVSAGSSATYTLSVAPQGGVSFTSPVTLSCSGLPSLASCSFSSSSVTPGTAPASATLTISTTAPSSAFPFFGPRWPGAPLLAIWLGLLFALAVLAIVAKRTGRRLGFGMATCALLVLLIAPVVSCSGSGHNTASGTPSPGTPTGSYPVTVKGTSGQLDHTTTVTLAVQ